MLQYRLVGKKLDFVLLFKQAKLPFCKRAGKVVELWWDPNGYRS